MKTKNIIIFILLFLAMLLYFILFIINKEGFEGKQHYSQLKQDLKVLELYKNKKGGYFIEIGANNGIELSNTYLLEKDFNWKGICVEALPEKFNELKENRKNCININKAVYNKTGETLEFSTDNLLSGITQHIDAHTEVKEKPQVTVDTITLNDILEQSNAPNFIDYLSIDTEGSEYIILSAINFDKYTFGLIHLEHNFIEPRRTDMKNLLLSKGYVFLRENGFDDEYVHNSLK